MACLQVVAPKFEEFSNKYTDAVFLKCVGDSSPDATKLMKREGVRSVCRMCSFSMYSLSDATKLMKRQDVHSVSGSGFRVYVVRFRVWR